MRAVDVFVFWVLLIVLGSLLLSCANPAPKWQGYQLEFHDER